MKAAAVVVTALTAAFPIAASAVSVTLPPPNNAIIPGQTYGPPTGSPQSLIMQTQSLLSEVEQLQAQLGVSGTSGTACPQFSRSLSYGASGADVTALQQYLAADSSVYPEGQVTGFFGTLTQAAVQRFQAKYGVVSSGSPSTTGFGVVGPLTQAAIAAHCSGGSSGSASQSGPVGGFIQVSPIVGPAPLPITVQAIVNTTNSCDAAIYEVSFGDGTASQSIIKAANNCGPQTTMMTHTYITSGSYQVTLSAGAHQTSTTVTVQ